MDPLARIDTKLVALQDQMQAQVETVREMRDILKELGVSIATLATKQQALDTKQQDHEERLQRLEGK